ncbi:ExbD/TolR family protein [Peijinzhouia sedimentorum]
MARSRNKGSQEINSGSMADIAFLLLIFFLVTTTIASDKGLPLILPPKQDPNVPPPEVEFNQRNIFKILINSNDQLLVEDEPFTDDITTLKNPIKRFLTNNGQDPTLSDSPKDAVVSVKPERGTSYDVYIQLYDIILAAYNECYAEKVGLTPDQFRNLDLNNPREKALYDQAREDFPRQISIAEPTKTAGGS